jgi:hypothetical protein
MDNGSMQHSPPSNTSSPGDSVSSSPQPFSPEATPASRDITPTAMANNSAVSLSGWKLTLPVNADGDLGGKAQQLRVAAATSPWLIRNADGSLTFWAPSAGATTPNSRHSRTELVSDSRRPPLSLPLTEVASPSTPSPRDSTVFETVSAFDDQFTHY